MSSNNKDDNQNKSLVPLENDSTKQIEVASNNTVCKKNRDAANEKKASEMAKHRNVLGTDLEICSTSPMTGYTRTGKCETNEYDVGTHLLCAKVTNEFLKYTKSKGNDLSTPTSYFPGLKAGDRWCLCVSRWAQAYEDGAAPPPVLEATHQNTLDYLKKYKLNLNDLRRVNPQDELK